MNMACVIGNGPSRLDFDLDQINKHMTTYGCNALYRDFMPDYLVSMDIFMVDEILRNRVHHDTIFYTQHTNKIDDLERSGEPINFVQSRKSTTDSGTNSVELACQNNHDIVYIIGFDYSDVHEKLPNVYAGTPNYSAQQNSTGQDIKNKQRLKKLVQEHSNTTFVRVNGSNNSCDFTLPNYSEITREQFKEIYEQL